MWGPDGLHLFLVQDERQVAPVVRIRGGLTDQLVTMTPAEAERYHITLGAVLNCRHTVRYLIHTGLFTRCRRQGDVPEIGVAAAVA